MVYNNLDLMTATHTEVAHTPHRPHLSLIAANLNIFAVELGSWALEVSAGAGRSLAKTSVSALHLIEKSKKRAIAPMLPRNSLIGSIQVFEIMKCMR